jgi:hypothetical protein
VSELKGKETPTNNGTDRQVGGHLGTDKERVNQGLLGGSCLFFTCLQVPASVCKCRLSGSFTAKSHSLTAVFDRDHDIIIHHSSLLPPSNASSLGTCSWPLREHLLGSSMSVCLSVRFTTSFIHNSSDRWPHTYILLPFVSSFCFRHPSTVPISTQTANPELI